MRQRLEKQPQGALFAGGPNNLRILLVEGLRVVFRMCFVRIAPVQSKQLLRLHDVRISPDAVSCPMLCWLRPIAGGYRRGLVTASNPPGQVHSITDLRGAILRPTELRADVFSYGNAEHKNWKCGATAEENRTIRLYHSPAQCLLY